MRSLPANVLTHIRQQAANAHSERLHESMTNIMHGNNLVRLSAERQFDQPSPANAMAVNKILNMP